MTIIMIINYHNIIMACGDHEGINEFVFLKGTQQFEEMKLQPWLAIGEKLKNNIFVLEKLFAVLFST